MDRFVSQARRYDFAMLAVVREDLHWLPATSCSLVSCLLTMAHVAHTVGLSAYVCHALRQLATRNLRTPLVVQMVDAQSFENCTTDRASDPLHGPREQQAAEEVLVHSDYPARGRATKRLTSCPQLTSHDRTLDDASSSSGRQTEKKMLGSRARSLVRRFAERSSNPKFGIAIFEYSRPAASRNDLEFSICRESIMKARNSTVYIDRAQGRRLGAKSNRCARTQKSSNSLIRFRCSNSCFLSETDIAGHESLFLAKWHPNLKPRKKLRKRRFFDTADRHEKLYGRSRLYVSAQGRHETGGVLSLFSRLSFDISIKKQREEVIFRLSRPVSCKNQENGSGKRWSLHAPLKFNLARAIELSETADFLYNFV